MSGFGNMLNFPYLSDTQSKESMSETLAAPTQASTPVTNSKPSAAKGKIALALLMGAIAGFGINNVVDAVVPDEPKSEYASNQLINTVYGIDVIENPEFGGDKLLKINDETKLAEVCTRPTINEVAYKMALNCITP